MTRKTLLPIVLIGLAAVGLGCFSKTQNNGSNTPLSTSGTSSDIIGPTTTASVPSPTLTPQANPPASSSTSSPLTRSTSTAVIPPASLSVIPPTSTWIVYQDARPGLMFLHPNSKVTSLPGGVVEFDLADYPKHPYVTRRLQLQIVPHGQVQDSPCQGAQVANGQITINGITYKTCESTDAGAGSRYLTRSYLTTRGAWDVYFNFGAQYPNDVRVIAGCENVPNAKPECQPFDNAKDTEVFYTLLFTVQFKPYNAGVIQMKTYQKDESTLQMTVRYPQMSGNSDSTIQGSFNSIVLNRIVNDFANQMIKDHTDAVKNGYNDALQAGPWTLTMDGGVTYQTPRLINVFESGSQYTGGAHPNAVYANILVDTVAKRQLRLSEVFIDPVKTWNALSSASRTALSSKLYDATWLNQGTTPVEENFIFSHFTKDGLVITFPPYQVTDYASGPQEVTIPWATVTPLLKPEFR